MGNPLTRTVVRNAESANAVTGPAAEANAESPTSHEVRQYIKTRMEREEENVLIEGGMEFGAEIRQAVPIFQPHTHSSKLSFTFFFACRSR